MSGEAPIFERSWPVGRYMAHLTVPRPRPGATMSAVLEWKPGRPRDLTERDRMKYLSGRNKAVAELAAELGVNVAVVTL